jgi:ABC-type histidine transport system ATPase subunit
MSETLLRARGLSRTFGRGEGLAGRSPRAAKRQAGDLLDRVGLADRAAFLPAALSGASGSGSRSPGR